MTETGHIGSAGRLLALLLLCAAPATATAQEDAAGTPLPPPNRAPQSRLTVTPSEFEQWMAAVPATPDVTAAPEEQPPSMVTPPPPPPALVTPPPPPALVTPPIPPSLTPPAPTPPAATETPAPSPTAEPTPGPAAPAPPPPALTPLPEAPQVATLPPDSPVTTPVPAPPAETLTRPGEIRILYAAESTGLPKNAAKDLDRMAAWLRAHPELRVQIVGYASQNGGTASKARRRSLDRTLAVRTYLMENGVLSTRMDVRAMGARTEEEPKDRVEVRLPPY